MIALIKFIFLGAISYLYLKAIRQHSIANTLLVVLVIGVFGAVWIWICNVKGVMERKYDTVSNKVYRIQQSVDKLEKTVDKVNTTKDKIDNAVKPINDLDKKVKDKVNGWLGREKEE